MCDFKLSICFAKAFAKSPDLTFDSFYEGVKKYFEANGLFYSLEANIVSELKWPRNPGVYVVWKKPSKTGSDVLYIGMAGKFRTDGKLPPKQGLHHRPQRFHPYCFTNKGAYANHFEFEPKFGVKEILSRLQHERYGKREALDRLRIDCFTVSREGKAAPAALESMLLQMYLEQFSVLPPANNKF